MVLKGEKIETILSDIKTLKRCNNIIRHQSSAVDPVTAQQPVSFWANAELALARSAIIWNCTILHQSHVICFSEIIFPNSNV